MNGLENKSIYLILFFFIPLLWMNTSPPHAFAQNNTRISDSLPKALAGLNTYSQWMPLKDKKQEINQNTTGSDLKELQALSYLQGYNPAPLLKNVTIHDKNKSFPGYNLFLSADAPEATLMDMNGMTVHRWRFPHASLHDHQGYYAPFWGRARILKNGDLLALIPYSGLLKINKSSHLIWFRRIQCHHDLDIDSNGNIYTLTERNSRLKDNVDIRIDSITILSPDGKIKKRISLYDLFEKYHDPAYINKINELSHAKGFFNTNNGTKISLYVPGDVFHSNSIQVLDGKWASKIPAFKKGNLLISIRHLGVIICVDPDKEKIVWLMDTVFWEQGQHFAKLLDNGNILLFDNYYRHNLSRVVEFDPAAKKIVWDYSGQNGRFFSLIAGECYRLPNGNTLITESASGHSFEVTPDRKIVWEYYNPHQIDTNSNLSGISDQIRRFSGRYNKLIAVIYQMQRIPIDSTLDWRATASVRRPTGSVRHEDHEDIKN